MIYFVTGNKRKYKSAEEKLEKFDLEIEQKMLDIIEPQSEDIQYITKSKAEQAYSILQKPVLVADSGVSILALGGFPGPFMHFITKWLSVEDLLNLTKDKKNRTIVFENTLAYKDRTEFKVFSIKRKGEILKTPKGKGIPLDQIITFRKDKKTIAECESLGISRFDNKSKDSLWTHFGEWYRKHKTLNPKHKTLNPKLSAQGGSA